MRKAKGSRGGKSRAAPWFRRSHSRERKASPGKSARELAASAAHRVERAAGELRRGRPVLLRAARAGESAVVLSAETASGAVLDAFAEMLGRPMLALTHHRARTLKIRLYTPDVVCIGVPEDASMDAIRAIADPTFDLARPLKGPFDTARGPLPESAGAAVKLAKLAGLLPAALLFPVKAGIRKRLVLDDGLSEVPVAAIGAFDADAARTLGLAMRARVPLVGAENAELAAFRPRDGGPEHYAVIIGAPPQPGPVLARIHSECFTGDLLGSLRCDCGDQLRGAIRAIAESGGGVLLYLAQEGRGIGLMNKLRAYRLQDQGFDTMEANERLGFEADERLYAIAAAMLKLLGYGSVRLLTNNPDKVAALETAGIRVIERVPHAFPDNDHSRAYLATKARKGGHLL